MRYRLGCACGGLILQWAFMGCASELPPAIFEPGSVILFQGDSITHGMHLGDMNHVYGHGYACEIASRYQAYRPKDRLEFANRGVSGNTSSNLVERWARDAFPYEISENGYEGALGRKKGEKVIPDCVSVLVGINDYFHFIRKNPTGVSVGDYEANLRKLIESAKTANPKVRIVLCEPFRIPTDASPEFCRRQDVVAKLAAELDCAFVPFQKLFAEDLLRENPNPRYWFWDFFHPTPAGHMRMADFWIESVGRRVRRTVRNTAVEPRAKLEDDSYDWYARHERIVKDQAKIDPEIVFIGDSITHGWEANDELRGDAAACFRKWFGKYRTLNMGFGWDRIQNVLWRLSHGEMDGTKPRVVVIHIGTNNTAPGYKRPFPANTAEEIAEGIVEVCRRVREKAPSAKIVLMDVFPRGGKDQHWRKDVAAVNAALGPKVDALADGNLVRISLWDKYVGPDGEIPKELMFDTLHPTVKGYDIWGEALQPILEGKSADRPPCVRTFCNPLPLPNLPKSVYINCGGKGAPHRQVSDPNLVRADGAWYLFPSAGFVWESTDDGGNWKGVPNPDGFAGHGPGAMRHRGKWYYIPNTDGELLVADRAEGPYRSLGKIDLPQEKNPPPPADAMLFSDDDGRLYLYWGCTPRGGIWGCELDAENPLRVVSEPVELVTFDPEGQPWERSSNNPRNGWLEGAWMVKLNGRYCLTFSAGGAENETYAMGAYWSDTPLADFRPQRRNPFFVSPKGLVTGTGHGSVVRDERGQLWVSYCIRVGSRHWFERLVGMDRLRLDANGEIEPASATAEPQLLPSFGAGEAGWRRIPVRTRSAGAADESLQTFTWLLDLPGKIDYAFEKPQVVRSFRICWREDGYDPDNGVPSGPFRYRLVLRDVGGRETVAFDASAGTGDRLVDYREISPTEAIAARLELLATPPGIKAGVSDFALFGEPVPRPVPNPAQLKRIREGVEVYGIVHWGLNTYTDREWGFGDENPADLNPLKFDADQIVGACKAGGLQGLIVVAKHHDGFCLWPTKTTGHNISKSPFRDGRGDYVKEMEQACRRHGLKFGVYVSPWDRNSALYGTEKYVTDVFQAQIRELLSGDYGEIFEMWFDGANGGDGYYGGAREKRKIPSGYYRYETETFAMVRKLQPNVCIFNESDLADFRFGGNEQGKVDPDSRSTGGHYDGVWDNYKKWANTGLVDGSTFHPIEADFPLRPGWFYHAKERGRTKNAAYLMQRYLATVGNAATLNLGIAPNREGLLDAEDVRALRGFGALRAAFFAREVDPAKERFNVVVMREDVSLGEQVDDWRLEVEGKILSSGKSIGIKRIRVLDNPVSGDCKIVALHGTRPVPVKASFYAADPELVRLVQAATTESGETDTAKWMTAGTGPACPSSPAGTRRAASPGGESR